VNFELGRRPKLLVADTAAVRAFSAVDSQVCFEIIQLRISAVTDVALVRALSSVPTNMQPQVGAGDEFLRTEVAGERPISDVSAHVYLQQRLISSNYN